MRSVYFAHPVDFANSETGRACEAMRVKLSELGCTVFDPARAFTVPSASSSAEASSVFLQEVNLQALERADVVLAYVPRPTGSFGVPFEVGYALAKGRPLVLLVGDGWGRSLVLRWLDEKVGLVVEGDVAGLRLALKEAGS